MDVDSRRPLRLLSLDGGGVRGISTILIIKQIMAGVNAGRTPEEKLEPLQAFDMMGGTSTGGIIAIMLGRLRLSLDECEAAYLELSKTIFTPRRRTPNLFGQAKDFLQADGRFDSSTLENGVKNEIRKVFPNSTSPEDELLRDLEGDCKVFVVSARQSNSELVIFRSYENPEDPAPLFQECKIWEACRATSAATTFFDPITIGKFGQTFLDGGIST